MSTDIGPKIGIQGEAQFRRELSQINTDLKTLGSEMKVVTSEFIGNEKSTEALTAKNQVLEATVVELTQKQQLLQQQLIKTAEAYGSGSKQAQALQQQYNHTTAQINSLTSEIGQNSAQIGQNDTLLGRFGGSLGDIAQKFGVSSSTAGKMTSALGGASAAYVAAGAAVVQLTAYLNDLSHQQAQHIDQINTLAARYHTTSQAIEAFQYAEKFTDVSTETMLSSISRLTRSMNTARDGTGQAAEAFRALKVDITNGDGSLRNAQDTFLDVIDALGRVGNETERDALAMGLLGRNANELNGVIAAGSDGLRQYAQEAQQYGVIISDEANARLQSLQDTTDKVDSIWESTKTNAGAAFAPVSEFFELVKGGWGLILNDLAVKIGGLDEETSQLSEETAQMSKEMQIATEQSNLLRDGINGIALSAEQAEEALRKQNTAILNMTESERGWRDLVASDPLDMLPKDRAAYVEYLRQANATQQELGRPIGIASYDSFMRSYNAVQQQQNITVNATIEVDGAKLAHVMVDPLQNELNRRGPNAFGGSSRNSSFY